MHLLVSNRPINIGEDVVARDAATAIQLISTFDVTHLYLDTDLGEDFNGTPKDSGLVLLKRLQESFKLPRYIQVLRDDNRVLSKFLFGDCDYCFENSYWTSNEYQD
jgi:hypothetical protein